VVALRRVHSSEVAPFLRDTDPLVVLEAARTISDLPLVSALPQLASLAKDASSLAPAFDAASARASKPDASVDLFAALMRRVINANFRIGGMANANALATFAASGLGSEAVRAEAVSVLGDWPQPSGRDNVTGLWRPLPRRDAAIPTRALQPHLTGLLRDSPTPVKLAAVKVATKLGIQSGAAAAYGLVADATQPSRVRVEALKALASKAPPRGRAKLAQAGQDEALRAEATKIEAQLANRCIGKTAERADTGSTAEKQTAFATLGTLPGSAPDETFVVAGQARDPASANRTATRSDRRRGAKAEPRGQGQVGELRTLASGQRRFACLSRMPCGGNAEEGRKIFLERVEVSCVRCHKAGGEGGEVGPDLTGIGSRQPREYLLESIVYPNKHIATGFENVTFTLKNGAVYAGMVKSENDTEIELNSPEDGLLKLKKADVQSRERGLSAMPEELRQVLTKQDMRSLVEFLSSLK
jgi:quinoprotein glucose dehydrogenase